MEGFRYQEALKKKLNGVLRMILLFTFIFSQTSCASDMEGKGDSIDMSVNGIHLLDPESYLKASGKNIKFFTSKNVVYTQHYNRGGDEMLTVISMPDEKFNAIKFRVAKLNKKFLMKRNVMKDIDKFCTVKGVCLGMTPIEISEILGNQYHQEITDDGIIIYRYKMMNAGPELKINKNRHTTYSSAYYFYDDKLIEFVFGF